MNERINLLYQEGKKYLKELRRAPDKRKKRWLVVSSAISMILVVALWVFYLNLTLPRLPETEIAATNAPQKTTAQKDSFFKTFSRGLSITFENLKERFQNVKNTLANYFNELKNQIQKSNEFSLSGPKLNFAPEKVEPIPSTPLP